MIARVEAAEKKISAYNSSDCGPVDARTCLIPMECLNITKMNRVDQFHTWRVEVELQAGRRSAENSMV